MGGHLSYEEGKKVVVKGLIILAIVTIAEVIVALLGKGYLIKGFHLPVWLVYFLMISMSLYKAYFIVYDFMHMRYEVPGLVKSVLMPTLLLTWALIAFFTEGKTWKEWRARSKDTNLYISNIPVEKQEKSSLHNEIHPGVESTTPGQHAPVEVKDAQNESHGASDNKTDAHSETKEVKHAEEKSH